MLSKMSSDSGSFEIERRGLARELGAVAFRGPVGRSDVAVSPDGTTIAVASARRVLLLDSRSGELVRSSMIESAQSCERAVFSADGVLLFVAGWVATVFVRDARTLTVVRVIDTGARDTHALAACPGVAHFVYSGGLGQHSSLWDMRTGRVHGELRRRRRAACALAEYLELLRTVHDVGSRCGRAGHNRSADAP
jgi:WD40 repeat protein